MKGEQMRALFNFASSQTSEIDRFESNGFQVLRNQETGEELRYRVRESATTLQLIRWEDEGRTEKELFFIVEDDSPYGWGEADG